MTYVPAVIVLMIIYMTSLVGLTSPNQHEWYLFFSPHFIALNALFLVLYHKNWNKEAIAYILGAAIFGLGFEYLAQSTNAIYGPYSFGDILEPSIGNTPLVMGLYWLILTYSSASIATKFPVKNKYALSALGTALMLFLALLIQTPGYNLTFWYYAEDSIPVIRYALVLSVVGFIWQYLFQHFKVDGSNKMSIYVYGGFVIFFVGLWMFL